MIIDMADTMPNDFEFFKVKYKGKSVSDGVNKVLNKMFREELKSLKRGNKDINKFLKDI